MGGACQAPPMRQHIQVPLASVFPTMQRKKPVVCRKQTYFRVDIYVCVCVCKLLLHPAVWFSLKSVNFLSKRKQVHMKDLFLQACHRVGVMAGGVAFAEQRLFLAQKGAGTELPAEAGCAGSQAAGSIAFLRQAGVSTHTCLCTCACTHTCMLSLWLLGC